MSSITLIIVRHGDAVSADIDPQRPLSRHGVEEATKLASALSADGVNVTRVVHSGKVRAQQTAEIVGAIVAPDAEPQKVNGLNPNDDPSAALQALEKEETSVLVAGHMPSVGRLTRGVVPDAPASAVNFWTGSAVRIDRDDDGNWSIVKIYDSREL